MSVQAFTQTGNKSTTAPKLDRAVFGLNIYNHQLLKQAYVAHLASHRTNAAQVKKRGEVSGGGRKPWRQKGTGRARFGSSRNPIWRGGGVAFGPTGSENYTKSINQKARQQALKMALSMAVAENRLIVLEKFANKDAKTAKTAELLRKIGAEGSVLLVLEAIDDISSRATNNLSTLRVMGASSINTYEVMNADSIVIENQALTVIAQRLKTTRRTIAADKEDQKTKPSTGAKK